MSNANTKSPRYPRAWGEEPIDKLRKILQRRAANITPANIKTATEIRYLMCQAETKGQGSEELLSLLELKKRLGEDMFGLLYDFLHLGYGLAQIEKSKGWSARSAKVVLVIALHQVEHFYRLASDKELAIAS